MPSVHILADISGALLLAGMMIGTWEFGEFTSLWIGKWGPRFASIAVPWALVFSQFSAIDVPWSIFAVGITTVAIWGNWGNSIAATLSFVAAWEVMRENFHHIYVSPLAGGAAILVFSGVGMLLRKWSQKFSIAPMLILYLLATVVDFVLGHIFKDPHINDDFRRGVVLLALVTVYIVFRTHRRHVQEDITTKAFQDFLTQALTRHGLQHAFATAEMADQALLLAKRQGKNKVVGYGEIVDEVELQAENRMLATAAQRLWSGWQEAAALTDASGRIIAVNKAYEELTGRTQNQLLGHTPGVNSAGHTPPFMYTDLWRELNQGDAWHGLFLNQRPDGSLWWAYEHVQPILGQRQEIIGYWAHVKDFLLPSVPPYSSSHTFDGISIIPHYQPIIRLTDGHLLGYEILSRPHIGTHSFSPDELFTLAELLDQASLVDKKCLAAIAEQLERDANEKTGLKWFINVRVETLNNTVEWRHLAHKIANIVGVDALVWEMSEKGRTDSVNKIVAGTLWDESLGSWAVDDWGSGQHPLARMQLSKPAWIKVDRSWICAAAEDESASALLLSLLQWAKEQAISTVAEGIETYDQANLVMKWGFDAGQGYFFGKPSPTTLGVVSDVR